MPTTAIDVVAMGSISALLAMAVALAWSVRRLLPLQLAGIIALAAAGVTAGLSGRTLNVAVVLAGTITACLPIAILLDWLIDRPLRRRPPIDALLASAATLAVLIVIASLLLAPISPASDIEPSPSPLRLNLLTLGLCLGLLAAAFAINRYLKIGLAMRAVGYQPETAALMGINPDRILLYAVALGALMAATGGSLYALHAPPARTTDLMRPVVLALAAATIAGPKRLGPAVVAGAVLGCLDAVARRTWIEAPVGQLALPFVALLVAMLMRPPEPLPLDANPA